MDSSAKAMVADMSETSLPMRTAATLERLLEGATMAVELPDPDPAKRGQKLRRRFFRPEAEMEAEYGASPMQDDAAAKMQAAMRGRGEPLPEWVFMVDDDSYVFIPQLLATLAGRDPDKPQYLGYAFIAAPHLEGIVPGKRQPLFGNGGAGILVSRGALAAALPIFAKCEATYKWNWPGDVRVAQCLLDAGVTLEWIHSFHAEAPGGEHRAVKVFATTLDLFRNRADYVEGDYRYRHVRSHRKNPRQLVSLWAEKEHRNLLRLHAAGVPCPEPILQRGHMLIMRFLGNAGWPAPQLKELPKGKLSLKAWTRTYDQVTTLMRRMWRECKLVHADLSGKVFQLLEGAFVHLVKQGCGQHSCRE